ncbi:transposase family protein [Glycomyces buryatensis]|uniref:transposase family protein n=1 Tax=Glycomyces buryatensis TaxID=2570927 RepID=UPI001456295C|nr:transposase family protein [Glycomyces buryatensis]
MHYPGTVTLSTANLQLTARLIARHRAAIGSYWRKLDPSQQALLALVYLRKHETYAALAEGWRIGQTTAWRYIREVITLLEALAPTLQGALWAAASRGLRWLLLDGTCAEIDRINDLHHPDQGKHVDRHWCHKHRHHAVTFAALTDHDGHLVWIGTGYPGSTHDLTAARSDDVFYLARKADLELFADKGYTGAGERVTVPVKGKRDNLAEAQREHNHVVNSTRALVERGFAVLKQWKLFERARCCPTLLARAAKAVLVLELNAR